MDTDRLRLTLVICFLLALLVFGGCVNGPVQPVPTPTPPVEPPTCSEVYVVSNCWYIYGTVFVNGIAHGEQIPMSFGSTAVLIEHSQIHCGDIVSVYIQRPDGYRTIALTENAEPPRTIFTFDCETIDFNGDTPPPWNGNGDPTHQNDVPPFTHVD